MSIDSVRQSESALVATLKAATHALDAVGTTSLDAALAGLARAAAAAQARLDAAAAAARALFATLHADATQTAATLHDDLLGTPANLRKPQVEQPATPEVEAVRQEIDAIDGMTETTSTQPVSDRTARLREALKDGASVVCTLEDLEAQAATGGGLAWDKLVAAGVASEPVTPHAGNGKAARKRKR